MPKFETQSTFLVKNVGWTHMYFADAFILFCSARALFRSVQGGRVFRSGQGGRSNLEGSGTKGPGLDSHQSCDMERQQTKARCLLSFSFDDNCEAVRPGDDWSKRDAHKSEI